MGRSSLFQTEMASTSVSPQEVASYLKCVCVMERGGGGPLLFNWNTVESVFNTTGNRYLNAIKRMAKLED